MCAPEFNLARRVVSDDYDDVPSSCPDGTLDCKYQDDPMHVVKFHMILWTVIFLIVAVWGTTYVMYQMDPGYDGIVCKFIYICLAIFFYMFDWDIVRRQLLPYIVFVFNYRSYMRWPKDQVHVESVSLNNGQTCTLY